MSSPRFRSAALFICQEHKEWIFAVPPSLQSSRTLKCRLIALVNLFSSHYQLGIPVFHSVEIRLLYFQDGGPQSCGSDPILSKPPY